MHKKFLRTYGFLIAVGYVMNIGWSDRSAASNGSPTRYTDAFESAIRDGTFNRGLHQWEIRRHEGSYSLPGHEEVGWSRGPGGITTHYREIRVEKVSKWTDYVCENCGFSREYTKEYEERFRLKDQKPKLAERPLTKVIQLNVPEANEFPICLKPNLRENPALEHIWSSSQFKSNGWKHRLETMGETARWLDSRHPQSAGDPAWTYVVETPTRSCCVIL